MKPSEFLTLGKAKIDAPEKWTKKAWARTKSGISVCSANPDATCFCSEGAMNRTERDVLGRAFRTDSLPVAVEALEYLNNASIALTGLGVIRYNDKEYTTHEKIMEVWNKAIETAQKDCK